MDLKDYVKKMSLLPNELNKTIEMFLEESAMAIINQAKKRTPVDTGALRASWYMDNDKVENWEITIGNNQEYASYLEYGVVKTGEGGQVVRLPAYDMVTVPLNNFIANQDKILKRYLTKVLNVANDEGKK